MPRPTSLLPISFCNGDFQEAVDAIEVSYKESEVTDQVVRRGQDAIRRLVDNSETQGKAKSLAGKLVEYLRDQTPEDTTTEAGKTKSRQLLFFASSVYRAAKDDQQVVESFRGI